MDLPRKGKRIDGYGWIRWWAASGGVNGEGEKREAREGTQGKTTNTKTFERLYGSILILHSYSSRVLKYIHIQR